MASAHRSPARIEHLENRQLFTTTLAPSAVEGTYTGTDVVTYNGKHLTQDDTIVITSTRETLTISGVGTVSMKVTSKILKKLRQGSFTLVGSVSGVTINFEGTVSKAGKVIKGTGSASGKLTVKGAFSVTKITG